MPPLLADFTHARPCKPFCEKYLTLPWAGKENRRFPDNYKNVGTWTGVSATIIFTQIAKYGVREKECLTREERAARQTRIAFVDWSHEAKAVSELCEG